MKNITQIMKLIGKVAIGCIIWLARKLEGGK